MRVNVVFNFVHNSSRYNHFIFCTRLVAVHSIPTPAFLTNAVVSLGHDMDIALLTGVVGLPNRCSQRYVGSARGRPAQYT